MLQRLLRSGTLPDCGGVPTTVVVTGTLEDWLGHAPHGTVAHADTDDAPPAAAAPSADRAANGLVRGTRGECWQPRDLRPCTDSFCSSEVVGITITMSGQPLALGRTSRLAKALLRLALAARDRGCVFPGCDRPPAWCEAHHVIEWQNGGTTDLGNLCLLCSYHHREFGRRGWSVRIAADGLPEWIPPAWIDPQQRPVRNRAHHSEIEFATDAGPPS